MFSLASLLFLRFAFNHIPCLCVYRCTFSFFIVEFVSSLSVHVFTHVHVFTYSQRQKHHFCFSSIITDVCITPFLTFSHLISYTDTNILLSLILVHSFSFSTLCVYAIFSFSLFLLFISLFSFLSFHFSLSFLPFIPPFYFSLSFLLSFPHLLGVLRVLHARRVSLEEVHRHVLWEMWKALPHTVSAAGVDQHEMAHL